MTAEHDLDTGFLANPAPLPDPERAARDALARHRCVTPASADVVEAAVDHAVTVRHGADYPAHEATVRLMSGSKFVRAVVDAATSEARTQSTRWELEVARLRRMNVAALRLLNAITAPDGHPQLAVALSNARLVLGSSGTPDAVDRYLTGLNELIGQVPGAPGNNQGATS